MSLAISMTLHLRIDHTTGGFTPTTKAGYPERVIGSRGSLVKSSSVALLVLLLGCPLVLADVPDVAALLAGAEAAFDRWTEPFDFIAYEASLREAISLWEDALPLVPDEDVAARVLVLNRLSQAWFELATAYQPTARDREATFEWGKEVALAALELDPEFVATREADGFRAALRAATDIGTIFWYGNALGSWLDFHRMKALFGGVRDVGACFERSIELDETYDGGGPHRAMAIFIAQAYFVIGRSRSDAVAHFERSIEIDPTYLENYVNYAEYHARGTDDDLFDRLLEAVFAAADDPAIVGSHPLYNHLAIQRARALAGDR
jgi:tetratricopeptide (TPR) repeat protein